MVIIKKLAFLLILIGIGFISFGGYQFLSTKAAEEKSLNEAKELLGKTNFSEEKQTTSTNEQTFHTNKGETVGILEIPRLNAELPIVEGTDPDELEKGVGHYFDSAYPKQDNQIVLSGHRDTVFRGIGDVKVGDILTLKLPYGNFTYEMVSSKIVDADDTTVIKPTSPDEELILTTCYPFSFVGDAPERYIITAKPIY